MFQKNIRWVRNVILNESSETKQPPSEGANIGKGGKATNPADIITTNGIPVAENVRGAKPVVRDFQGNEEKRTGGEFNRTMSKATEIMQKTPDFPKKKSLE